MYSRTPIGGAIDHVIPRVDVNRCIWRRQSALWSWTVWHILPFLPKFTGLMEVEAEGEQWVWRQGRGHSGLLPSTEGSAEQVWSEQIVLRHFMVWRATEPFLWSSFSVRLYSEVDQSNAATLNCIAKYQFDDKSAPSASHLSPDGFMSSSCSGLRWTQAVQAVQEVPLDNNTQNTHI